jgi:very-short-patch-repair endonuclease
LRFTPSRQLQRAKKLRENQTEAEMRLWGYLRAKRLQGWKFNRQVPVGSYIVDFLCEQAKLVVEVDGSTHGETHEVAYDAKRTAYLQTLGYRVLRCYNVDVFENLTGVLDGILLELNSH